MLGRPNISINSTPQRMEPGYRTLDGRSVYAVDGDNQAIPLAALIAGIVNRTGTTGATGDSLPTVTSLLAAVPNLMRGDSLRFSIRMANAHANTITVGTGMTAVGTVNVAASNIRDYLLTLTSDPMQTTIQVGTTTNASATLSGFTQAQLKNVGIGMAITGTGIGVGAKVLAVNLTAGTITASAVSTATASDIAMTFTPQADLLGLRTGAI